MNLSEIAEQFGTPAYVYDVAIVRAAANLLRADLPTGARLFYSLKANPHPLLVAALCAAGCDAEVSSIGEVSIAVAAGYSPDRILFNGPGKSYAELTASLTAGVRLFSVESLIDRNRLAQAAADIHVQVKYLVRLNGPAGSNSGSLKMTGRSSPFGTDTRRLHTLTQLLEPHGPSQPIGLHTFFATNIVDERALISEFDQALATVALVCEQAGFTPQLIDLGGGFAAPMAQPGELVRYAGLAEAILFSLGNRLPGPPVQLMFESGRHLVATAGTLLTRVLDIKRSGNRTFTVLDAGVNVLGGMSGLGRLLSPGAIPVPLDAPAHASNRSTALVGPLCTPLDVLNNALPLNAQVDDLLAIPNVGAYGLTASLIGFLSHPIPVEVVCDGDRILSSRRLVLQSVEVSS